MTNIVATNADTAIDLNLADRLYVPGDVSIITTAASERCVETVADAYSNEVVVDGNLIGFSSNAIVLNQNSGGFGNHTLIVGATGSIRSLNYQGNSAIYMLGSNNYLQNWGEVTGTWGAYMELAHDNVVENYGTMAGSSKDGLLFSWSDNVQVVNAGQISGGIGIGFYNSYGAIQNSGEILATSESGRAIAADSATEQITVINSGSLSALDVAIELGGFDDSVENAGAIYGDVDLGGGRDFFDGIGDGFVAGSVRGGSGNDTLSDGASDGDFRGGGGDDLVLGRAGADTLRGGDGDDTLRGGTGDDSLAGDDKADEVRGGSGDDTLDGGLGQDTLNGGDGHDVLYGGNSDDRIKGGAGDDVIDGGNGGDTIEGGAGNDTLTGGQHEDVFVFGPASGSAEITDFENDIDRIDISAFGIKSSEFDAQVLPALSNAGSNDTVLDLGQLGGSGLVLITDLAFGGVDSGDFIF